MCARRLKVRIPLYLTSLRTGKYGRPKRGAGKGEERWTTLVRASDITNSHNGKLNLDTDIRSIPTLPAFKIRILPIDEWAEKSLTRGFQGRKSRGGRMLCVGQQWCNLELESPHFLVLSLDAPYSSKSGFVREYRQIPILF